MAEGQSELAHPVYKIANYLSGIHILAQMAVGATLIFTVTVGHFDDLFKGHPEISVTHLFDLGAQYLAVSTLIELGWLLFTPGPDEALDPVILATATAALWAAGSVDGDNVTVDRAAALFLIIAALIVLLALRTRLQRGIAATAVGQSGSRWRVNRAEGRTAEAGGQDGVGLDATALSDTS